MLILLTIACSWSSGMAQERRVALVIGNSAYRRAPLENPVNDAQAMATTLGSLGFTITKLENASQRQMSEAIRAFGETLKRGGVGLFYFAGHGIQIHGENFLIPVDDDIRDEEQVATKGVIMNLVLQAMADAKNRLNIVILDACRNNPFRQGASRGLVQTDSAGNAVRSEGAGGLAPVRGLVGTFIAFATEPHSVAADGHGKNGVYTENLLRYIIEPDLKIEDAFKRVRFAVRQETNNRQVPWENTSLEDDFYFAISSRGNATSSSSSRASLQQAPQQQTAQQANRSGHTTPTSPRSPSGFSFTREDAKDQAALTARDDAIRERWQVSCPDTLRRRPIVIDITETSHTDGLVATEKSARFAQIVQQDLQQAGLTASLLETTQRSSRTARAGRNSTSQGSYAVRGVVLSEQSANSYLRLRDVSISAELTLQDPAGRIVKLVEVSGESFAGQNSNTAAWKFAREQARDASSQLYEAFCSIDR